MAGGGFVKSGGNNFTLNGAGHIGNLFRTLVNQQYHQITFRMIAGNGMCDILKHNGLTGAGRRHNQAALSFSLRRNQVYNTGRIIFFAANNVKIKFFGRIKRGQIIKIDTQLGFFRIFKVDFIHFNQSKIPFVVFWSPDFSFHRITGAQTKLFNLCRRNVNVIRAGKVI